MDGGTVVETAWEVVGGVSEWGYKGFNTGSYSSILLA